VLTKKDIHAIADAIGDRNIMILSDEIYSRLIYEAKISPLRAFRASRSAPSSSMASRKPTHDGWRMGYGVMRSDLATHVSRLMTNSNSCTASFTQVAGIEALRAINRRSTK